MCCGFKLKDHHNSFDFVNIPKINSGLIKAGEIQTWEGPCTWPAQPCPGPGPGWAAKQMRPPRALKICTGGPHRTEGVAVWKARPFQRARKEGPPEPEGFKLQAGGAGARRRPPGSALSSQRAHRLPTRARQACLKPRGCITGGANRLAARAGQPGKPCCRPHGR